VITWIIGSGGLLGSALTRQAGDEIYHPGPIPWQDPEQATITLHQQARDFERHAGHQSWRVIWAAGAATTSTRQDQARQELKPLEGLLTGLRSALPTGPGTFVLASSAGGVYAGSQQPPFTATTRPAPLSPYGELKLAQEGLAQATLGAVTDVMIARISNLYGPGQNLGKLQGLISHLARAAITRQPVNVFVPLDTTRDYIYADDAAAAITQATHNPSEHTGTTIEIVASGRGTTIGQLIRAMNEVTKRRVPVALGTHPSSAAQATDLRVTPTLSPPELTTLPTGIKAVHADLLRRMQEHPLTG